MSSFPLSWSYRHLEGLGGQPKVVLTSDNYQHRCEIYFFGATVTSWIHNGTEKLFTSPVAIYNGEKAIRGGIPIVFPQFGHPKKSMAQHGFARTSNWALQVSTRFIFK